VFEDGEQPHLHWEVLLDNKYVNPAEYQVGD
jgi:murein DD-endopeptidase MepM/ murein hydrolase activator NlpD